MNKALATLKKENIPAIRSSITTPKPLLNFLSIYDIGHGFRISKNLKAKKRKKEIVNVWSDQAFSLKS